LDDVFIVECPTFWYLFGGCQGKKLEILEVPFMVTGHFSSLGGIVTFHEQSDEKQVYFR
jgi:hypothetical protein